MISLGYCSLRSLSLLKSCKKKLCPASFVKFFARTSLDKLTLARLKSLNECSLIQKKARSCLLSGFLFSAVSLRGEERTVKQAKPGAANWSHLFKRL